MTLTITGSDSIRLFEVGGCVRDAMLGVRTKDIDFAVEAPSFSAMRAFLVVRGFEIFVETPEFLTIRARFPKAMGSKVPTADFVLCRKDSATSDGRRPDFVEPGTIFDDLARRDFTVNAMAIDEDGKILDPHNGIIDLGKMRLRFVGDPDARIREDALRVLRGVRFAITKGFSLHPTTMFAMRAPHVPELLAAVSTERIREELELAFKADTITTVGMLTMLGLFDPIFERGGLRLSPTMKG